MERVFFIFQMHVFGAHRSVEIGVCDVESRLHVSTAAKHCTYRLDS